MASLVTYEDIYTAICEELKIQLTDGSTVSRIKRDINMVYLNEVIPYKPRGWWWLEKSQDVQTYEKITTGTITITDDSTTVTFSSAPASSVAGYYLKVSGFQEIIEVLTHTGGVATATLKSAWRRGNVTAQNYTLWKDSIALDSDVKEVVQIVHEKVHYPINMENRSKFMEIRAKMPDFQGHPKVATVGDFDSDGNRVLSWYPSCDETRHTMHLQCIQEATALSDDADEPLMPVEDRICLYYGGCSRAWARERNESEAGKNWTLFISKMGQMAGKGQSAPLKTELSSDPDYLINKRYRRLYKVRRNPRWESD